MKSLLAETRLLTLTGSGGCGKTRLSLQAAAELLEQYPEGVWLMELAPLTDPTLVPQTVAQALNLPPEPGKPVIRTLVEALKTRCLLLVLDNCEHLLDACAQLVDTLIRSCPRVRILASSREGLGIAGETVYRIPSLSLPERNQTVTATSLGPYEAIRLFIERALAAQPAFTVTNQNAPALVSVCHRLDGIPLAIELAATRVRSLSVEEINRKLDNCFRLLTGGSRTALPRQQTLRALIDWSYSLLSEPEKTLLCRLAVFAGGWTLEAAEAVCEDENMEAWELLDLLTSLADKSLVLTEIGTEMGEEQTRYRLLETVRQYARDRLAEGGESESVRRRHQACFLRFVEETETHLHGPESARWLRRLESEHDNLRAALEGEDPEAALRIAGSLVHFWEVRGYCAEGRKWLTETLARSAAPTLVRARALNGAGALARIQADYPEAQRLIEQSLALAQELGDKKSTAAALSNLATVISFRGDRATGRAHYEQSLALYRELGDKHGIARCLANLGHALSQHGDYAEAKSMLEQSLAFYREAEDKKSEAICLLNLSNIAMDTGDFPTGRILTEQYLALYQELGDRRGMAHSYLNLGFLAFEQGDSVVAESYYAQSKTLYQEMGDRHGLSGCLVNLGHLARKRSDYALARDLYEQGLALFRELGFRRSISNCLLSLGWLSYEHRDYLTARPYFAQSMALHQELNNRQGLAYALEAFASLAAALGEADRAPRLWGAAERLREEIGVFMSPLEVTSYAQLLTEARSALDAEAFATAWSQGRAMTLEQAIAYAQQDTDA